MDDGFLRSGARSRLTANGPELAIPNRSGSQMEFEAEQGQIGNAS